MVRVRFLHSIAVMSNSEQIKYSVDNKVAVITLNRPQVLNALTPSLINDWEAAIQRANEDDEVAAIWCAVKVRLFVPGRIWKIGFCLLFEASKVTLKKTSI